MEDEEAPATRVDRPSVVRPTDDVTPGAPIDARGRYEAGREIARGGMGRVVEATDTLLGRVVAIKEALALDADALARFERETRVTARLEHPAIVPVYDAGRMANGTPFYVMRKIGGVTLDKLARDARTVDERLALLPPVLAAVDAVAHAHGRGVIHRDLKPSNILVGALGETIVIDWGLAKIVDEAEPPAAQAVSDDPLATRAGSVVGTPGFMPPEQLAGARVTPACDVYALGGTLYHVLAGVPPHEAGTGEEMMELAKRGPPRPIARLVAGYPPELLAIVERAMAYDAAARYADAGALAADLRAFLTGQLVAAHRYSTGERLVRFAKRHRAAVAATTIAAAATIAIGALAVGRIVRARDAADEAREHAEREQRAADAARRREAARADDLLVAQAAALVATNPSAAVALLRQLPAGSGAWLAARDVLVDARAHGVPRILPASDGLTALAIAGDGSVAYSGGSDGVIRHHDLEAHTSSEVARVTGHARVAITRDGRTLAYAGERPELVVRDVASGTTRTLVLAGAPAQLIAGRAAIAWADTRGAVWLLRPGEQTPRALPAVTTKIEELALAPDDSRLAVAGDPGSAVIELAEPPRVVVRRQQRQNSVRWSRDGSRLAITYFSGVDELDFGVAPPRSTTLSSAFALAVAYDGDDLYVAGGDNHIYRMVNGRAADTGAPVDSYDTAFATRDAVGFVAMGGLVTLVGKGGRRTVRAPVATLFRAAGAADAMRFVVGTQGSVLAFDAAPLLPRIIATPTANTLFSGFVQGNRLLMAYMVEDWKLFDLPGGQVRTFHPPTLARTLSVAPDGSYILVRPQRTTALALARPGQPPQPLDDSAFGTALSPTRVLVVHERDIVDLDLTTGAKRTLWTAPDAILAVQHDGPFIAAATRTQLWRRDDRTGATATLALGTAPSAFDLAPDGAVYLATGAAASSWPAGGAALVEVGRIAQPIEMLVHVERVGLVAVDKAHEAWLVAAGAKPESVLPATFPAAVIGEHSALAIGLTTDRQLVVRDLEGKLGWTLGDGELIADLSDDGRFAATYANGQVAIYTIDLPRDRAAYERLLDATLPR